jgi:hypothetical protein
MAASKAKAKAKAPAKTKAAVAKPAVAKAKPVVAEAPKATPKPVVAKANPVAALTPDETARVGFFAKVVDGIHKGRYGLIRSMSRDIAVLETRDDNAESLLVHLENLRPDHAGRR